MKIVNNEPLGLKVAVVIAIIGIILWIFVGDLGKFLGELLIIVAIVDVITVFYRKKKTLAKK